MRDETRAIAPGALVLSVIIPAYNERDTIAEVIAHVVAALPDVAKQIIVVDDGSTDGTREWLTGKFDATGSAVCAIELDDRGDLHFRGRADGAGESQNKSSSIRVILHEKNSGKGQAVRTGIAAASGDVVVIQDADLEYDPADWATMLALFDKGVADAVYGSRFYGKPHRVLYFYHLLGNKIITWLFNLLFNQTFSDLETCYKMFRRSFVEGVVLHSTDFGIEVELSALLAKAPNCRIYEMGIAYYGRTYAEGKKIGWRDGVKALWYVIKFRISPPTKAVVGDGRA